MNLHGTPLSIIIFSLFVALVLYLSYYFARRARSAAGYFAAGGQIHWAVNGISFAGDYLSAASFLGICGMIATLGYDGFLYSIGYLAGWIVALFVVAEPMKRMGKFTFTDALDAKFNSRGIKLAAAISTLVVSICYLIPQMNGAGSLVEPLLGLPHWAGVIIVGVIVITIVATAGMTSTTYVQFLKGGLLLLFSTILVGLLLMRGISTEAPGLKGDSGERVAFTPVEATHDELAAQGYRPVHTQGEFTKFQLGDEASWWVMEGGKLHKCQWQNGELTNGSPDGLLFPVGRVKALGGMSPEEARKGTGSVSVVGFLAKMTHPDTRIEQWHKTKVTDEAGRLTTVYFPKTVSGTDQMKPGVKFKVKTGWQKLNFVSLMLALFFGTAALPHILIRYYTVPSPACARKSTIVAIAAIGFFYVLTLFMGLGAGNQQHGESGRQQHVRPLAGPQLRRGAVRHHLGHRLRHRSGHGGRAHRGRQRRGGPRSHGSLRRHGDDRDPEGQSRQGGRLRGGHHRHHPGHRLQGCERELPGGLGLRRGGLGQPAGHSHAPVLEEDHGPGHHRLHLRGHRGGPGHHPDGTRHVRGPLRQDGGRRPAPPWPARHHLHPVELPDPGGGVVGYAEERGLTRPLVWTKAGTPGSPPFRPHLHTVTGPYPRNRSLSSRRVLPAAGRPPPPRPGSPPASPTS